jgi:hypothetical protein
MVSAAITDLVIYFAAATVVTTIAMTILMTVVMIRP